MIAVSRDFLTKRKLKLTYRLIDGNRLHMPTPNPDSEHHKNRAPLKVDGFLQK